MGNNTSTLAPEAIKLCPGDTLEIRTTGTPGAGYSWSIETQPSCLTAPQALPAIASRPGVPGSQVTKGWRWAATQRCNGAPLVLVYSRPWDPSTRNTVEYRITVATTACSGTPRLVAMTAPSGTSLALRKVIA